MKLFYLVHSIGIWKLVWGTCFCQHYSVERWQNFEVLALELGCKVGELPSSYLGLPLGALHKSMVVWDGGMEERFRKRLALWKR